MGGNTRKQGKGSNKRSNFRNPLFYNVELSAADKRQLHEGIASGVFGEDDIDQLCLQGFKASKSFDAEHDTCIRTLSFAEGEDVHIVSGRGSTFTNATASVLFKFHVKLNGRFEREADDGTPIDFG